MGEVFSSHTHHDSPGDTPAGIKDLATGTGRLNNPDGKPSFHIANTLLDALRKPA